MKIEINQDLCIGCGLCVDAVPDIFEVYDDEVAAHVNDDIDGLFDDYEEDIRDAVDNCPTGAITINEED